MGAIINPLSIVITLLVVAIVVIFITVIKRLVIANPNEALIITGSRGKDDSARKIIKGRTFVWPFIQKVSRISLRAREINIEANGVTANNISVDAKAVAIIKVSSEEAGIRLAAERFLDMKDEEIESFSKQVLSGALRALLGKMTVEEVIRDRDKLANNVLSEATQTLHAQGLSIDTLQITSFDTTSSDYIKNLSRQQQAQIRQEAEIAEANAMKAAELAKIDAQKNVLDAQRDYSIRQAEIQKETDKAKAEAAAAGPLEKATQEQQIAQRQEQTAKAQAQVKEQELVATVRKQADADAYKQTTLATANKEAQIARAESEKRQKELEADAAAYARKQQAQAERDAATNQAEAIRVKAEAEQKAGEAQANVVTARGQAEGNAIFAKGEAEAKSISARSKALKENKEAIFTQQLIEELPSIITAYANQYNNVDNISIVSTDGQSKFAAGVTQNAAQLQELIKGTLGIDLSQIISNVGSKQFTNKDAHETVNVEDKPNIVVEVPEATVKTSSTAPHDTVVETKPAESVVENKNSPTVNLNFGGGSNVGDAVDLAEDAIGVVKEIEKNHGKRSQ